MTTETSYEQTNMKIQTFIYDLNSFLAVCYLGTLNSKTRRPTEIICSTNTHPYGFAWTWFHNNGYFSSIVISLDVFLNGLSGTRNLDKACILFNSQYHLKGSCIVLGFCNRFVLGWVCAVLDLYGVGFLC